MIITDIEKLLESIAESLKSARESIGGIIKTAVYDSEPVTPLPGKAKKEIKNRIREMKALAENPNSACISRGKLFYKQAKLMEDYEDDFHKFPTFHHYYPTYRDMNDEQLRCYFTWRTRLRRGEFTKIGVSYIFVYIYELLNLVGCNSAEDGFEKLIQLYKNVDINDPDMYSVRYYLKKWIFDFAIYYGISPSLLDGAYDIEYEAAVACLLKREEHTEDEVFSALCILSVYNVEKSALFREYPEDYKKVAVGVYDRMSEYCEKHRKNTYFERLFGRECLAAYRIFESAVFIPEIKIGYEYSVSPIHSYRVSSSGAWYVKRFAAADKKNKSVGALLKSVDRIMREKYGFGRPLAEEDITKILSSIIHSEIDKLKEEKKRKERAEIKIDMSILSDIRRSADITRDRLIVEEEIETDEEAEKLSSNAEDKAEGLSQREAELLYALLRSEKYKGADPVSLIVDSINEKLFDRFSDTVIEFDGEEPRIIEDYIGELEMILK